MCGAWVQSLTYLESGWERTDMQKIPIDKQRYICFDEVNNTAKVVIIPELEKTIYDCQTRLAQLPVEPDEKELLQWAKENFPTMDYSKEKQYLEAQITEAQELLEIK